MKKITAKTMGYKVIDEFGFDISSRVYLELENNKIVKVIDEFDIDIALHVKVIK